MAQRICDVPGCGRPHHSFGKCRPHRNRMTGRTASGEVRVVGNDGQRWLSSVVVTESGCWQWSGSLYRNGYGKIHIGPRAGGRHRLVHRWVYEQIVGPIPEGLELDHLCRNRACCNPAHLEPVTRTENQRRATPVRTHCPQGHAFDNANTYVDPRGTKQCRTCRREALARSQRRRQNGLASSGEPVEAARTTRRSVA